MNRTETSTRNYTTMADYLRELSMIGDGIPSENFAGECWTMFGKRVLYTNDWGTCEVLVFRDANDADAYTYAMTGPIWDEGYIIREDTTNNSGTACYTVEDPSGTVVAVASEWSNLAEAVNADMERSGYFPGVWLDDGTPLTLTVMDGPPTLSRCGIPDPVRYS